MNTDKSGSEHIMDLAVELAKLSPAERMQVNDIAAILNGAHRAPKAPAAKPTRTTRSKATSKKYSRKKTKRHPRKAAAYGAAIKTKRLEMGVTQREAEKTIGETGGWLSAVEAGRWMPRLQWMADGIKQLFGVDIADYQ